MAQICKKCLLREMAEADAKMIEKYKEAIKIEDQASESEYERRLSAKPVNFYTREPAVRAAAM